MKDAAPDDGIIDRVRQALERDLLPKAARGHAAHLLQRLSSPVRVTLLGNQGSGKSELVNMLLGRRVLPKSKDLPTTEVLWGEDEEIEVTAADGKKHIVPGLDFAAVAKLSPVLLQVRVPQPILRKISILEVVTSGDTDELRSAVDWAIRRTDITLWCSSAFDEVERALWSRVPDTLKDHAFLVLTKADVLSSKNLLSQRIADLETIVAEEFHSLFAVATLQGIKAQADFAQLDEAMFHGSGGSALSSEILRHAERGRRADLDSAHLFLARYQARVDEAAARQPGSQPKLVETPAKPEPAPPAAKPAQPSAEIIPIDPELFANAGQLLRRRGDTLAGLLEKAAPGDTEDMLEQCVETVEHLIDMFASDDSGCDAVDAFIDDLTEASEMMVLMQVEAGDGPAADAVTLLLQLRREIDMRLAA